MAHLLTFRQCKQIIIIKCNGIFPVKFLRMQIQLKFNWFLDVPGRSGIFKN